jgi:tetratricopeptide (TPR) repeat protein
LALAAVIAFASVRFAGKSAVSLVGEGSQVRQLRPGFNLVRPFAAVRRHYLAPTYNMEGDGRLVVPLARGMRATLDCTVSGRLDPTMVVALDRQYGEEVADKLLRPLLVREISRALSLRSDPGESDADAIGVEIRPSLRAATAPLGLEIDEIKLVNLDIGSAVPKDLTRSEGFKVFIVGLDGYDWKVADLVSQTARLDNIQRLKSEGAWGNLQSIEPLVSPLIWTTIATGVTPDIHGIMDFLVKDEKTGEEIPATSAMRRVPALWNMASLCGLRSGFVGWLATYPAEAVDGFIVTDRLAYHMFDPAWFKTASGPPAEGLTYPPDLLPEAEALLVEPRDVATELGAFVRGPVGELKDQFDPNDVVSNLRLIISGYRTYENAITRLYPEWRPDLSALYLEFTDSASHLFMRYMAPAMRGVTPEDAARYGSGVSATYQEADRILGEVLAMIDERTLVIVVSDHGFKSGDMRPASDSRIGHGQAISWHRMDGVIAMYGPVVKRGFRIPDAGVLDIAPTVLYLLGLPVDKKMSGRVLIDALDPAWTGDHPVRYTAAYDSLLPASAAEAGTSAADQALKDKLVSLGYVAGGNASLVNMANFYQKNGKFAEAIEVWKQLLEADPRDVGARIGISNAYFEIGRADSAIAGLSYVLKVDPRNLEALKSLATIHVKRGDGREALRVAEDALRVDPDDGGSHFNRGLALELLKRTNEAAAEYRTAVELAPDLAEAYASLAQIYLATGFKADALKMARRAVDLASDKPETRYMLSRALEINGNPGEAEEHFRASIRLNPRFVGGYIGAMNVLMAQGKADSAVALGTAALEMTSEYRQYLHNLIGSAHLGRGDTRSAESHFKLALEADRTFLPARLGLARAYLNEGKQGDARRELQAVLAADPSNQEALSLLQRMGQ